MDRPPALRRLIDLPGVADLEYRALLKREFAEPEARAEHPELDACSRANFGLTADEAGWDVTDDKRRPLRVLGHFNQQLWLAVRGVAGSLPYQAEDTRPDAWATRLAADAKRFRQR